jgi:hypothetical protein
MAGRSMKQVRYAIAWVAMFTVASPLLAIATIRGAVDNLDDKLIGSRFVDRTLRLVDRLEMWSKR